MGLDPDRFFSGLDLSQHRKLTVAVSGGSDSLALLFLLKAFLDRLAPHVPLLAVTVDHGLRPEAAGEARAVAALCLEAGIGHRTMVWHGGKPATGLIAAAREARYRLLAEAAGDFGAGVVLTAHTMDDQAETVAMRARRGAGGGLAGMARATLYDERVWIARPLLCARRQELRAYLAGRGVAWIDDPTNENPAYERARVRAGLSPVEVETLAADASQAGIERAALAKEAASLLGRFASRPAPGLFRLDRVMFEDEYAEAAIHALRTVLAIAGGTPHLPDLERTRSLAARLGEKALRATLSRAVVDARKSGVWIRREARDLPVAAPPLAAALWDGRWRVAADDAGPALRIGPLGGERAGPLAASDADAPESLVRAALSLEPALFDGDRFLGTAGGPEAAACGVRAFPVAAPHARFLPDFELAPAAVLRRLLKRPPLPPSPWKNHIDAEA